MELNAVLEAVCREKALLTTQTTLITHVNLWTVCGYERYVVVILRVEERNPFQSWSKDDIVPLVTDTAHLHELLDGMVSEDLLKKLGGVENAISGVRHGGRSSASAGQAVHAHLHGVGVRSLSRDAPRVIEVFVIVTLW